MSVIAKFRCDSIDPVGDGVMDIMLKAVAPGDSDNIAEDERFHRFTPNGALSMIVDNPAASNQFVVGRTYYVHIEEAQVVEPVPA